MNDEGSMHLKAFSFLTGLLVGIPLSVGAATSTVTITVTVQAPPPCVINDNRPITVEFGEVMTTRVDGKNYLQDVNYTLSCTEGSANALKLQVKGTEAGAGFDNKVLRTDKSGLGIALLQGGSRLPINSWLNFTYPNQPALKAVPVKQTGITLSGGEFNAQAIMKVAYQ